jgi:hypothetical protein
MENPEGAEISAITNRNAKIATESGAFSRDCLIADISENGARLFSEAPNIPDNFQLLISGDKIARQECRAVWRLGGEIGVAFVTEERDQARSNAMHEFQSEVRNLIRVR